MGNHESKKLMQGALILTLAGLISKVLSAGYRIPLQNLTGDIGFYIYQQVYPILGMVTVLALYGFPSAISKLTAELKSEGTQLTIKHFYFPLLTILLSIHIIPFIFFRLQANGLADWVGDKHLAYSYKMAAFLFVLVPFTVLLRGVFQGQENMKPTALSQIAEQLIRVSIIISAAIYIFIKGSSLYMIGQAGVIAAICGSVIAIFILIILFLKEKPYGCIDDSRPIPWGLYVKTVLLFGFVASLNHMILLIIQFADTFTVIPGLLKHGLAKVDAMIAKGVFDRGQPLIQFGTVVGSSFALALIPTVSDKNIRENPKQFYHYIQSGLTFCFYLASGATLGLVMLFPETNMLLFKNNSGIVGLRILANAILLSSFAITVISLLQGLGYMFRTAGYIFIAFIIKWTANVVFIPIWGINGSALATIISLFVLCLLVLLELRRKLPKLAFFQKIKWKAFLKASLGMILYILIFKLLTPNALSLSRFNLCIWLLFIIGSGAFIYFALLIHYRAFSNKQLAMLPFSRFITLLLKEEVTNNEKN